MPRLIDADKYKADLWVGHEYLDEDTMLTATNILDSQPTIEAEPVRHGRWEECFEDWRHQIEGDECSVCGFQHYGSSISHYHYCPNCGAKMDGDSHAD